MRTTLDPELQGQVRKGGEPTGPPPRWLESNLHTEMRTIATRGGPGAVESILQAFWRFGDSFEPGLPDLDACLNSIARCPPTDSVSDPKGLLRLLAHVDAELGRIHLRHDPGRSLSGIASNLARLRRRQPPLCQAFHDELPRFFVTLEQATQDRLEHVFEPRHLTQILWAFAKAGTGTPTLYSSIGDVALRSLGRMTPRDLSNVAWSYATVKQAHEVVHAIARRIASKPGPLPADFGEQDISNLAWSYATLRSSQPELFRLIDAALKVRASEFLPKGLANTTWAFAILRCQATFLPEVLQLLRSDIRGQASLDAKGCAVMLWSLATMHAKGDMVTMFCGFAAERVLLPRMGELHGQDVSNIVWAFAKLRVLHERLFVRIEEHAKPRLSSFSPQALSNLSWSYAKMQVATAGILEDVAAEVLRRRMQGCFPQALVTIAWALMETKKADTNFMGAVMLEYQRRPADFNDIDIATLAAILLSEIIWPEALLEMRAQALASISREASMRRLPRTSEILGAAPWTPHA